MESYWCLLSRAVQFSQLNKVTNKYNILALDCKGYIYILVIKERVLDYEFDF